MGILLLAGPRYSTARAIAAAALCGWLAIPAARGWAPITHYAIACQELPVVAGGRGSGRPLDLGACIEANPDLISGDGFPDAFFFGPFIGGSDCDDFRGYHS